MPRFHLKICTISREHFRNLEISSWAVYSSLLLQYQWSGLYIIVHWSLLIMHSSYMGQIVWRKKKSWFPLRGNTLYWDQNLTLLQASIDNWQLVIKYLLSGILGKISYNHVCMVKWELESMVTGQIWARKLTQLYTDLLGKRLALQIIWPKVAGANLGLTGSSGMVRSTDSLISVYLTVSCGSC